MHGQAEKSEYKTVESLFKMTKLVISMLSKLFTLQIFVFAKVFIYSYFKKPLKFLVRVFFYL